MAATAERYVPATIRSGIILEWVPLLFPVCLDSYYTSPAPVNINTHLIKIVLNPQSGSFAAFLISVSPSAKQAASIMFSVAPTLVIGNTAAEVW